MNILAKVIYGSHLYGTSTPESDSDWRAVYLPTLQDCALGRVKDAWTDPSEEDTSYFSLQKFLAMAVEGQSLAIEMLCANDRCLKQPGPTPIWFNLRRNRCRFFSRQMSQMTSYASHMAEKYCRRAERMAEVDSAMLAIQASVAGPEELQCRLRDIWDNLPESPNCVKQNRPHTIKPGRFYVVCGRELQDTCRLDHTLNVLQGIRDQFGQRVTAAKDGRVDYVSLHHAFRAALQCREIVTTGDLTFPLKDAPFLLDVKLGRLDFVKDSLDTRLDDLIREVEGLMARSDLPDHADQAYADSVVLGAYGL